MLYASFDVVMFQLNWNKFLLSLDESLPINAEQLPTLSDHSSITNVPLTNASDETTVTLADYFRRLSSCQFLVIVFLRHFAWLPWRDHISELQSCQVLIICMINKTKYYLNPLNHFYDDLTWHWLVCLPIKCMHFFIMGFSSIMQSVYDAALLK